MHLRILRMGVSKFNITNYILQFDSRIICINLAISKKFRKWGKSSRSFCLDSNTFYMFPVEFTYYK